MRSGLLGRGKHYKRYGVLSPHGRTLQVGITAPQGGGTTTVFGAQSSFNGEKTIKEVEKSQRGRLWSIYIFSFLMLFFATQTKLTQGHQAVLVVIAVLVIFTVGLAYLENKKRLEDVSS